MRIRYMLLVIVLLILSAVLTTSADSTGTLEPDGPPDSTFSYTLEDIYDRLASGTAGAPSTFTEPTSGPTVGTMHTLNDIMSLAPQVDPNGATQTHVLVGRTMWGLTSGQWGLITGTMPDNGAVTLTPTTINQTIAAGYHNGSGYMQGDADLVAGNIRSGANIFGVAGDSNVVNTSSGDATAGDIVNGKKAWVDGSELTGTYPFAAVPKTGQTASYATGDDGALERGVTWPIPRFTDNGNGSVTDNLTGLIWLKDANCIQTQYPGFDNDGTAEDGRVTWQHALDFVAGVNAGTYSNCRASFTDWRLPNIRELLSLVHWGFSDPALPNTTGTERWTSADPFTGVQSYNYWSSTTLTSPTTTAWYVSMFYGVVNGGGKTDSYYVWPVRGGQ